ncbi:unnamed protein product [Mucor hiemalis]
MSVSSVKSINSSHAHRQFVKMSTDPLTLLREFTISKRPVLLLAENNQVVDNISDAKNIKDLDFLVQNAQLDNSAYFKECLDESPNVLQASTSEKRARDDAALTESSTKKPKVAPLVSNDSLLTVKQVEFVNLVLGKEVPAAANGRPSSQKPGAPQSKPATASTPAKSAIVSKSKLSSKDRIPLIIVPAAPTAKFTLYNIKQFLEDQKYIDSQELRSDGLKKPERVTVERKKANGPAVPYHVVDSVATFKQSDWDRVCCVFVAGQLWQFKGWKWEKPVELFSNVKGFYPKWSTDKATPPASEWAVSEINIHRNKRHMDKATVSQFWDSLDSYNATHKSYLNF